MDENDYETDENDYETDEKNKSLYETADEDIVSISSEDNIEEHKLKKENVTNLDNLANNLKLELCKLKNLEDANNTPRSNTQYEVTGEEKKKKYDSLVYDEDHEDTSINYSDEEYEKRRKSWSKHKKHRLHRCLWKLKYNRIVSGFYLDSLRRKEGQWSWMIIVISTGTSGLTVANNVETEPIENYSVYINGLLTFSSMLTSLIAAWIKKQQFVEKINEIDKYLVNINSLCEELEIQFSLLEEDRLIYDEFKKKYIPEITKYVTSNPMIPPDEWKNCVREITLKYPELVDPDNSEANKLWPWYGDLVKCTGEDGKVYNIRKPTTFMSHMTITKRQRCISECCRNNRSKDNDIEIDDIYKI